MAAKKRTTTKKAIVEPTPTTSSNGRRIAILVIVVLGIIIIWNNNPDGGDPVPCPECCEYVLDEDGNETDEKVDPECECKDDCQDDEDDGGTTPPVVTTCQDDAACNYLEKGACTYQDMKNCKDCDGTDLPQTQCTREYSYKGGE